MPYYCDLYCDQNQDMKLLTYSCSLTNFQKFKMTDDFGNVVCALANLSMRSNSRRRIICNQSNNYAVFLTKQPHFLVTVKL